MLLGKKIGMTQIFENEKLIRNNAKISTATLYGENNA